MFFLAHALHLTGPLAIILPIVAMIALRLFFRRQKTRR
jgi:hypothetical protein